MYGQLIVHVILCDHVPWVRSVISSPSVEAGDRGGGY